MSGETILAGKTINFGERRGRVVYTPASHLAGPGSNIGPETG
jgi:hypothetical protein